MKKLSVNKKKSQVDCELQQTVTVVSQTDPLQHFCKDFGKYAYFIASWLDENTSLMSVHSV